jgi:molecular chaperone GrpE (heat shock protein)
MADDHLADWKDAMRRDFESWMESVDEIPDPEWEQPSEPDLYSFYQQLAIANTETRKANRRTAEAFSQWGDTLARFDADLKIFREQLNRPQAAEAENSPLPRKYCLALIEMLDRLRRLAQAFESTPPKRWLRRGDAAWRQAWETQGKAFAILVSHFEGLLEQEGVTRMECVGRTFDPTAMTAAAAAAGQVDNLVIEEFAPGYTRHGDLLRPAQVKVSVNRSNEIKP